MLLAGRLFGFVARESHYFSCLGPRVIGHYVLLWCRWRSGGPSVFRAPCGFSYWAWPLFVPVGGSLPARPGDLHGAPRAALSSISHVIPVQLIQTLKSPRWNCNVFLRSRKITELNYVRNLSGPGPVTARGECSQAPRLEVRPCPPVSPVPSAPVSSAPSTQVGHGVLLCWRAPTLPRVRYKILPARLLGGDNGTKLSLHVEKAPNRAILGEQGEFCTGSGAVRLVLGEFCTEAARRGSCWARFVSSWRLPCVQLPGFRHPPVPHPGPPAPAARSTLVAVGVLRHAKPSGGVSPACRTLAWRNSPRLAAASPRFEVAEPPISHPTPNVVKHSIETP